MVMPEKNRVLVDKIQAKFGSAVSHTRIYRGEVTHRVELPSLTAICGFLKEDGALGMNYLVDLFGVDYPAQSPRFEVVYHLYSIPLRHRLRLKVRVDEEEEVPSVIGLWPAAQWPEREAYDMYGILFSGHPELKRIYMADDWEGHPLRKDYPLRGYKDRYNPFGEEREEPLP